MYDYLFKRKESLKKDKENCIHILNSSPPGNLQICKNGRSTRWYVKYDNLPRKYLPKSESGFAEQLAIKHIYENRLSEIEKEIAAIDVFFDKYKNSSNDYIDDNKYYSLATKIVKPLDEIAEAWANTPFESNPYLPEQLIHPSPSGHILRSKSEAMIDRELFLRKIPFRYECRLSLGSYIEYPDFTFFNPRTGELRFWEHNGMMGDSSYCERYIKKTSRYINNGIYPGIQLLETYEDQKNPLTYSTITYTITQIEIWLNS